MQHVTFLKTNQNLFEKTLQRRVAFYFSSKGLSIKGDKSLYIKSFLMLVLFFWTYVLAIDSNTTFLHYVILSCIMGLGMAGVGMNVMHDANHLSFSRHWWVNHFFGSTIYMLAGNVYNWKVQHNVLHHTYTNIEGLDEDIDVYGILRLSPFTPWRKYHLFQPIYAFVLYSLLTLHWAFVVDFRQLTRYQKLKLTGTGELNPLREWVILIFTKTAYFLFWWVLPLMVLDLPFYQFLIGFLCMHWVAGFILSVVFQLAHVVNEVSVISVEERNIQKTSWFRHQFESTANFATNNKWLTYVLGGLNFQLEHHLFPNISHVHYFDISKIVKKTAKEFGVTYHEYHTFGEAFIAHVKQLKKLAKQPV